MSKTEEYMALKEQGMTYDAIAKRYGVTRQAVHDSISRHKKIVPPTSSLALLSFLACGGGWLNTISA